MRRLLAASLLLATPVLAQDRPVIVADSYPVAWMAEELAGDAAEVQLVVPEGRDPASWQPGLGEIVAIQEADLIVLNGSGLADWTTRAALPRARTVDTGRGLKDALIATETITHSHGGEGSHSHEGKASHTWLDLEIAARQAATLATALARSLPDVDVEARLADLQEQLSELNATGDALVTGDPIAAIASHPRYEYLGAAYGLDVTSLDWEAGVAPDADQLAALDALAAETGAQMLIWETEPPAEARDAVAERGLEQVVIPPLSMPPADGDFAETMRTSFDALGAALAKIGQ
ncbi:metal ABC transporter substrate-binding protein [Roseobacter sp. HKCCA0434]|uniref:metal ABC transporter substrate-binding protein n=1 Tax=Roseobacter sp. HKCCA0434 TaxID=3079297 RepID=UPI002905EE49|nr:metal ABC transporter substrate-binding protein [Roseobacter sp. HKCCA0434]